jgi:hypothetical protein
VQHGGGLARVRGAQGCPGPAGRVEEQQRRCLFGGELDEGSARGAELAAVVRRTLVLWQQLLPLHLCRLLRTLRRPALPRILPHAADQLLGQRPLLLHARRAWLLRRRRRRRRRLRRRCRWLCRTRLPELHRLVSRPPSAGWHADGREQRPHAAHAWHHLRLDRCSRLGPWAGAGGAGLRRRLSCRRRRLSAVRGGRRGLCPVQRLRHAFGLGLGRLQSLLLRDRS